jgi:hypothetical protein
LYGDNWLGMFARYAMIAIKNKTTKYKTEQFFINRDLISNDLHEEV